MDGHGARRPQRLHKHIKLQTKILKTLLTFDIPLKSMLCCYVILTNGRDLNEENDSTICFGVVSGVQSVKNLLAKQSFLICNRESFYLPNGQIYLPLAGFMFILNIECKVSSDLVVCVNIDLNVRSNKNPIKGLINKEYILLEHGATRCRHSAAQRRREDERSAE